ncbi:hypothetical protein GC173_10765 [bacterium]|nr:hypothetical protein [bacterium]
MLKRLLVSSILLGASLTSTALAIPYASGIQVSSTSVAVTAGLTISYTLNEDADSVSIEVLDSGNSVVATFAGTATVGLNSVVWNGRNDNAAGAFLTSGTGYKVRVTAAKNTAAGWTLTRGHRSLGNLGQTAEVNTIFAGFSPNTMLSVKNPSSDAFGKLVVASTYNNATAGNAVAVVMNPDLSLAGGYDGSYANRLIKGLADATNATGVGGGNNALWGLSLDPDDLTTLYGAGQIPAGSEVMSASLTTPYPASFADADSAVSITNPRDIAVQNISASKFAFLCRGGNITRFPMTGTAITAASTGTDIVGTISGIAYSKDVEFDADGNLYWVTQAGLKLFRWDAATVAAATAGSLLDTNAAWVVTFPERPMFVKVAGAGAPGGPHVFVSTTLGVYDLGLATQATKTVTLLTTDRAIELNAPYYGTSSVTYSPPLAVDYVGNVIAGDRVNEHVRMYSPGGNTSIPVTAPASQSFALTSNVPDWTQY